jgi:hypothetical protein
LLSDRLAIISSGELQCVGTTMYLKHKYGEGYNLIIELTSRSDENELRQEELQMVFIYLKYYIVFFFDLFRTQQMKYSIQ